MRAPAARKDADLDPMFEYFRADMLPTEEGYVGDPGAAGPQRQSIRPHPTLRRAVHDPIF